MDNFLERYKELRQKYMEHMGSTHDDPINVTTGQKFHKLIVGTSVYAFIDRKTGDIFMPSGWYAPAKHVRGNIYSKEYGMEAFDSSGNVRYLR